jgi:hypothetical protein
MRLIRPSSENEMVAVFLSGELDSDHFGPSIRQALRHIGSSAPVVTSPDLANPVENALRRRVLDEHRGYLRREGLFAGFPGDVRWDRVALTPDEIAAVRYIDWSYWLELSGGTRRPSDAAARIRAGVTAYGVPNDGFLELAEELRRGVPWSPLIVVSARPEGEDIVLEGHARLTAMALPRSALPAEIEVLRGVSCSMALWYEY